MSTAPIWSIPAQNSAIRYKGPERGATHGNRWQNAEYALFKRAYTDPPGAPSSLALRPTLLRATRTNMAARASVVVAAAAAVSASGLKAFGLTV